MTSAQRGDMGGGAISQRIAEFPKRCRAAGLKVTPQRMAVYSMLIATDRHPCPDDVYTAIRSDIPAISLATVYKILDLFQERGFVRRVSTEGQVARYDAMLDPHHHLVCSSCGRIQDLMGGEFPPLQLTLPAEFDFQATGIEIQFHGQCGACSRQHKPARAAD
ncbi:MAG: transcriptional repressor [Candidatus Lambdaproteobacteria bacterium]|nr:transcriptional repressor [Candidatus Lambdaproteobacteria bacterium]